MAIFTSDSFSTLRLICPTIDIERLSFLDAEFEVDGVDVVLCAATLWKNLPASLRNIFAREHDDDEHTVPVELLPALKIELKPVVGDDYPAVLRQMRANKSTVLLVGAYNGTGATREQFVKTFATANIKVVFADEIEAAKMSAE